MALALVTAMVMAMDSVLALVMAMAMAMVMAMAIVMVMVLVLVVVLAIAVVIKGNFEMKLWHSKDEGPNTTDETIDSYCMECQYENGARLIEELEKKLATQSSELNREEYNSGFFEELSKELEQKLDDAIKTLDCLSNDQWNISIELKQKCKQCLKRLNAVSESTNNLVNAEQSERIKDDDSNT